MARHRRMSTRQARTFLYLFAVAIAVGGAAIARTGFTKWRLVAWEVPSWTPTPATIVESSVVESRSTSSMSQRKIGSRRDTYRGPVYRPHVVYSYTVRDRTYTSERFDPLELSSSDREAQSERAAMYRPGQSATAFVNPSDPSQAVLQQGSAWWPALTGATGIVLVLSGFCLTLVAGRIRSP